MVGDFIISNYFFIISNFTEVQRTGTAEQKEREPMLVLDGVGTRKCWSEERRLMIMNVRKILWRVCISLSNSV